MIAEAGNVVGTVGGVQIIATISIGVIVQIFLTLIAMVGGIVAFIWSIKHLLIRVSALEKVTEHISVLVTNNAVNERRFMNIEDQLKDFRAYIVAERKVDGFYPGSRRE